MKIIENYKGLPKSIYFLFLVQVINRLGDFVFPFLSLLLTQKLKFSMATTGTIVMIASVVGVPASFIGGKIADKSSRKLTYILGQSFAAIVILICGFINIPNLTVALLIASSFFNGFVRPTISAMVADLLPASKRQMGSSLLYLGINFGVAVGPIIAGFLFNNYLSLLFIIDALTSFIAVIIVLILIPDTKAVKHVGEDRIEEKEEKGNLLQILLKRPFVICFFGVDMIYSLAYRQCSFSMPIMMNKVFGYSGSSKYGFLMSVNALTVVALTIFVMHVTKRFRTLTNMAFSGLFYAVGFGMISIIGNSYLLFIISTVIWTMGEILGATNFGVYLANNSPRNCRARFGAVGELISSIGGAIGIFGAGKLIESYGINMIWRVIFIIVLLGAGLMLTLQYFQTKRVEQKIAHEI
ncbi:MFS family permease [Clostridium acetobutylicum]|uniref:Possible MDR-type permease, YQJV B.subtilis ortholog n=1 Tax=Clostridium acetobutylicum (strain ATCC 824 / DSM 792 / JCM 1419 / IAM 19013 / LMG 5710 / NBRC 13948 / NRRL B-527 / VKM B-1787 / 2291 / W) TaxID=272562 RepID=Q97FI4_CLOAB|nr:MULTISPECIES: MFS transporter [Clostridium]AAK80699.1 Possible MDR-type permease, YQJV B.subtilis ortholog [Clostridium acetobutylicum ATCC 824]ADZ21799.1 putative MDR-type permease [Clostridium acetobutylicum EA 2018]AEI33241.1 MDR-type permease [Clostridium acetobutylicum DSM 1731]AWV78888.1 MFS transporter [Clostridium acetobutylicum]MBC2395125.1 MFS transporter [Clostridium acetobutylicum]